MHVTLSDFKHLLYTLKENNIALRVKTHSGWSNGFLHIIGFIVSTTDPDRRNFGGVVLSNLSETEGIMINNIASITSFEVQQSCDGYQAGTTYVLQDNLKALIVGMQ